MSWQWKKKLHQMTNNFRDRPAPFISRKMLFRLAKPGPRKQQQQHPSFCACRFFSTPWERTRFLMRCEERSPGKEISIYPWVAWRRGRRTLVSGSRYHIGTAGQLEDDSNQPKLAPGKHTRSKDGSCNGRVIDVRT